MTGPMQDEIEKAHAEFERSRRAIEAIQHEMTQTTTTVTSKSRAVSVTVDSQGEVSEIKFLTRSYRLMPSAELGEVLVETISAARKKALAEMASLFQAVLPPGIPIMDMFNGTMDFDEMMREAVRKVGDETGNSNGNGNGNGNGSGQR